MVFFVERDPPMKDKKRGNGWILLGIFLVCASFSLGIYNLLENHNVKKETSEQLPKLEQKIQANVKENTEEQLLADYLLNPKIEMPTEPLGDLEYVGILEIPALELELPIADQLTYPNLRKVPCRYSGTAYQKDFVIAAHNYDAHFGRLKQLTKGDSVTVTDVDGNQFIYEVVGIEFLQPTAVDEMENGWDLTLFTCTLGGRERVTVRCEKITEIPCGKES